MSTNVIEAKILIPEPLLLSFCYIIKNKWGFHLAPTENKGKPKSRLLCTLLIWLDNVQNLSFRWENDFRFVN